MFEMLRQYHSEKKTIDFIRDKLKNTKTLTERFLWCDVFEGDDFRLSFEYEPRVIMFQQKKNNEYVNTFELDCEYLNGDHLGMYRFMWFSELLNIAKDKAEGLKMGQKPKADLLQRIKQFIGLKQK